MKTLVMNNSVVFEIVAPAGEELQAAFDEIVAQRCEGIALSSGTRLDVVFEPETGAARFAFLFGSEFLIEALVLCPGQGRHCWADFHCCCQDLVSDGRAMGQDLPSGVPDENGWNCIIVYQACLMLSDHDLGELLKCQSQLAEAYVRCFDQTTTAGEML